MIFPHSGGSRSTSVTLTAPGSAARTRTPTGCCASTFPREPTSACMMPIPWQPSRSPSTPGPAKLLAGKRLPRPWTNSSEPSIKGSRQRLLRRPLESADVSDAQWLQRLHEFGLLRASFLPKGEIAALRAYLRQRERLVELSASHIQHMQKALMQMNVQVHHVVSDIMGVTGLRILRAIVAGERDPSVLAS